MTIIWTTTGFEPKTKENKADFELTRDVLAQQEADRVIRLPGQPDRGNIQAVCSHG